MERIESDTESILISVNDIRIYTGGIEVALRKNKLREAEDYVRRVRQNLDTISSYLESKSSVISR